MASLSCAFQGFGCQEDTIFCGIFDGHGPWGHYVAKAVRDSLPPSLLCHWQEALTLASLIDGEKKLSDCRFDLSKQSYVAACAAVDDELRRSRRLDAVYSGSTALSIVKQGDLMVIANVGDSRAVLGTRSDDGALAAVQLTVDFKPNLPSKSLTTTVSLVGHPCGIAAAAVADAAFWNAMCRGEGAHPAVQRPGVLPRR